MNTKVLVALLAILAVLFVVGIGAGAGQDDGQAADLNPGFAEALGDLLVREQRLEADDVVAASPSACRQQLQQGVFQIPTGVVCTLVIGDSSAAVRTLPLDLRQGVTAVAVLQPAAGSDSSFTIRHTLQGNERQAEIQVFQEGGTLLVACVNSGATPACLIEAQ